MANRCKQMKVNLFSMMPPLPKKRYQDFHSGPLVPPKAALDSSDPVERAVTELEERSLLYVALTRARREAHLLSYGEPSRYLAPGHWGSVI